MVLGWGHRAAEEGGLSPKPLCCLFPLYWNIPLGTFSEVLNLLYTTLRKTGPRLGSGSGQVTDGSVTNRCPETSPAPNCWLVEGGGHVPGLIWIWGLKGTPASFLSVDSKPRSTQSSSPCFPYTSHSASVVQAHVHTHTHTPAHTPTHTTLLFSSMQVTGTSS